MPIEMQAQSDHDQVLHKKLDVSWLVRIIFPLPHPLFTVNFAHMDDDLTCKIFNKYIILKPIKIHRSI